MAEKIDNKLARGSPSTPAAEIGIGFWKFYITVYWPLVDNLRAVHVAVFALMALITFGAILAVVWMTVAVATAPHVIADFIEKTQPV